MSSSWTLNVESAESAKRLLERLASLARERGCRAMELDSAFHRVEAHAFYEKLGFEKRAFLFAKTFVD